MTPPVAKVSLENLGNFLRRHGDLWTTDGLPAFQEHVDRDPMTVDELLTGFVGYRPDLGYVYVFDDVDPPYDVVCNLDWKSIPTVDSSALDEFIIRSARGRDFLWVSPSDEDLANGTYLVILPAEPLPVEADEEPPERLARTTRPRLVGLSIENFKGIRERVNIPLRPITLLFGANSAGKSTVIHALHYAREIFERRNFNADRTIGGEDCLDLGGFASFVHGHDRGREIRLGFDLDMGTPFPPWRRAFVPQGASTEEMESLTRPMQTVCLEITIAWSELLGAACATRYAVAVNGHPLAVVTSRPGSPDVLLSLDCKHPVFVRARENNTIWRWHPLEPDQWSETDSAFNALLSCVVDGQGITSVETADPPFTDTFGVMSQRDALPDLDRPLRFEANLELIERMPHFSDGVLPSMVDYLTDAVSELVIGPAVVLRNLLAEMRYIGPLRQVPPRNYQRPRFKEIQHWADGAAAWNLLLEGDTCLVTRVRSWLADPDKLNVGYRVEPRRFKEFSRDQLSGMEALVSQMSIDSDVDSLRQLLAEELAKPAWSARLMLYDAKNDVDVEPQDVGVGVSQLVPVVVAVLDTHQGMTAIEQPELHLHPAVQVALGDLFIAGLESESRILLVETHSEHMLLRLLRRVRETHDGSLPEAHRGLHSDQIAVIYVEFIEGSVRAAPLHVTEDGDFAGYWPEGFFDERSKELF